MYVGVGIFTGPYAFAKVGIIGGPLILILFACLSYYTMSLQVKCIEKTGIYIKSYP